MKMMMEQMMRRSTPYQQSTLQFMYVVVKRSKPDVHPIRSAVESDKQLVIRRSNSNLTTQFPPIIALLLGVFAALALILAGVRNTSILVSRRAANS